MCTYMIAHLVPETTLTEVVTMVTAEDNNGVVQQVRLAKRFNQHADLVVDVRAVGKVGSTRALDVFFLHFMAQVVGDCEQSLGVRILFVLWDVELGHRDVLALIAVPVLLSGRVRIWRTW